MIPIVNTVVALALLPAQAPLPARAVVATARSRSTVMVAPNKIPRLEAVVAELRLLEVSEAVIAALNEELYELKNSAEFDEMDPIGTVAPTALDCNTPLDNARIAAEIADAKKEVRRSVALSDAKRTALLRSLQIKWHPDRAYGDETTREMATELSAIVNEAMTIAKKNIKARQERDAFRVKAYRGVPGVLDNEDGYKSTLVLIEPQTVSSLPLLAFSASCLTHSHGLWFALAYGSEEQGADWVLDRVRYWWLHVYTRLGRQVRRDARQEVVLQRQACCPRGICRASAKAARARWRPAGRR